MTAPSPSLDVRAPQQLTLRRRLARHFIALSVAFGVVAVLIAALAFRAFEPLLERVDQDWTQRELASIRSTGGLHAAAMTSGLISLLDHSGDQHLLLWSALQQRPEMAYVRIFNNVNAEFATVFRDGLRYAELPAPFLLDWDRSVYPPHIAHPEAYEKIQPVTAPGRKTYFERHWLLYRESFGRMFPIAVLTVGFDTPPASPMEADRACELCLASQLMPGGQVAEGWPEGRVLGDGSLLVGYSYAMRDVVTFLSDMRKGTDNLLMITVFNQNGVPFLSDLQSNPAFTFPRGLTGNPSLLQQTAHVRQRRTADAAPGGRGEPQAYDVFTPIFNHGALRGMIAFAIRGQAPLLGAFRDAIRTIRGYMVASTIAATTIMILASVYMALRLRRRIAVPLEAISQSARDFVHSDLTEPAHLQAAQTLAGAPHYSRESRRLAESYAQMVGVIQKALKEKDTAFTELQSTQKQLLISQRQSLLGVVAAGVAHEIKNALNPVKLRAERMLMAHQMKRDVSLEEGLNLIIQSVGRCAEISNKLSTFARPADAASHFPFDLNDVLRDALAITNDVLANAKVKVTTQFGDLPKLKGNPKEIQQAVINFLLNAKDAILETCKDGKRVGGAITISTAGRGNLVEMKLTDDGCGMSEETKQKLFVPFYTTKEPGKGTGLGMGVSQGILQAHNADIRVESALGKGTIIAVNFPVASPSSSPAKP